VKIRRHKKRKEVELELRVKVLKSHARALFGHRGRTQKKGWRSKQRKGEGEKAGPGEAAITFEGDKKKKKNALPKGEVMRKKWRLSHSQVTVSRKRDSTTPRRYTEKGSREGLISGALGKKEGTGQNIAETPGANFASRGGGGRLTLLQVRRRSVI